jgi:hypothetical protein
MSTISINPISIDDFINHYNDAKKNILFWDTCCLLDILRFPYRNSGNLSAMQSLIAIKTLIENDEIYSVCSSLTEVEWNNNEGNVKTIMQDNLELTTNYHKNSIDIINHIFSTANPTSSLHDKGLLQELENIVDQILSKTIFLNTDTISESALWRVTQRRPPASKKQEFKDCAIWETAISVGSRIQGQGNKFVFFTVNTDDYMDKSRTPKIIHNAINSEAVTYEIQFVMSFNDAHSELI